MTMISTPAKMTKTPVKNLSMKKKKKKSPKTENDTLKPKNKPTKTHIKDIEMKIKKEKPAVVTPKKEAKDLGSPKKSEKPAKRKHNQEVESKGENTAKKIKTEKTEKPKQEFKPKEEKVYEHRVFVGGLFYATTLEKVELLFNKFGKVLNVTMPMSKKITRNKGYAFVSFVSKESMDKALAKSTQLKLDSKKIAVVKLETRKPVEGAEKHKEKKRKKNHAKLMNNSNRIFVAKLKGTTRKKSVLDHFIKFGAIDKIVLPLSINTKHNRGYCFIAYKKSTSMEAALRENHEIEGRVLDVKTSTLKKKGGESNEEEDLTDEEEEDDEDMDEYLDMDDDEDIDDEEEEEDSLLFQVEEGEEEDEDSDEGEEEDSDDE